MIIDSNSVHTRAWELYLDRFGLRIDNLAGRMHGRHNDEIVRDFFGELSPDQVKRHGSAKEELYRELMAPQIGDRLVPGVREFIGRLKGVRLAVASNAEPANVRFVIEAAALTGLFHVVVSGAEVQHPKPAPEIYLRAAAELGEIPGDCIVFEDSPVGVAAARAAGMRVVGVGRSPGSLVPVELHIHDFEDPAVLSWLSRQGLPNENMPAEPGAGFRTIPGAYPARPACTAAPPPWQRQPR